MRTLSLVTVLTLLLAVPVCAQITEGDTAMGVSVQWKKDMMEIKNATSLDVTPYEAGIIEQIMAIEFELWPQKAVAMLTVTRADEGAAYELAWTPGEVEGGIDAFGFKKSRKKATAFEPDTATYSLAASGKKPPEILSVWANSIDGNGQPVDFDTRCPLPAEQETAEFAIFSIPALDFFKCVRHDPAAAAEEEPM